jgi:hypothetical protein
MLYKKTKNFFSCISIRITTTACLIIHTEVRFNSAMIYDLALSYLVALN